ADIGRHLGSGMGSFANIFEPKLIVIGGGFGVAAWAHLIGPAREILQREALRPMRDEVTVVRGELGTTAGLIGAGLVAFEALEAGERMALVTDAGLPGVSDPGARIVRAALDAGVAVTVLPGPSAVETALVASGLVGERYQFLGFLPRGKKDWEELVGAAWPSVAFESAQRLPATLRSLAEHDPARRVAVCRELTKKFE